MHDYTRPGHKPKKVQSNLMLVWYVLPIHPTQIWYPGPTFILHLICVAHPSHPEEKPQTPCGSPFQSLPMGEGSQSEPTIRETESWEEILFHSTRAGSRNGLVSQRSCWLFSVKLRFNGQNRAVVTLKSTDKYVKSLIVFKSCCLPGFENPTQEINI